MKHSKDKAPTVWRKSSYSGNQGNCVEVADGTSDSVPVRDSKDPALGHLVVAATSWTAMTASLRA